jgi:bacterioferritin-associated ferredoxin
MEQETNYPATVTAHTVSGPVHSCEAHAQGIKALMSCMGTHVNFTAAPEGAQCANCVNEAKNV